MELTDNRKQAWLLLIFGAIVLVILMLSTEGQYNDGDSITHYLISRFSFRHPVLFLHHSGKPLFTLLSAPFSHFGFYGIESFNILCALLSAWLCYRLAERLSIPHAPLVIIFVLFTPIYLTDIPTGLTEPLFGLVLISGILLLEDKRSIASAIVISLLPFARSEGYLMFPLFGISFLLLRQYKAIPFLATGFLIYSIIGWFVFGDLLWIIHQNPYTQQMMYNYGHGELLHFVKSYKAIMGIPIAILFAAGIITLLAKPAQYRDFLRDKKLIIIFWLVCGSFVTLVAAHSYFWWKGIFGSLGLLRVVAAVVPSLGIICLVGFNALWRLFSFQQIAQLGFTLAVAVLVVVPSVNGFVRGAHLNKRAALVKEACRWVKTNGLQQRMIYYSHPFSVMGLDIDPYDTSSSKELLYVLRERPSQDIRDKSIVIWESQFGPHEAHMPLDTLMNPAHFQLLKEWKGKDTSYKVMIFEKKP